MINEKANWNVDVKVRKFKEDISEYRDKEQEFYDQFNPYEEKESHGNLLLNTGIDEIWDLVTAAAGATAFDNGNAHIGVGDSATGADPTDTDLKAVTNKKYNPMEATYPLSTSQKVTFRSSFADGDANYQWNEWGVCNASGSDKMMNRKVEDLGTKTSGTWQLTVEITLS